MAVVMSALNQKTQTIASLQAGLYIPEKILSVHKNHALLWGGQKGINRHIVLERIDGLSTEEMRVAMMRKPLIASIQHENIARCEDVFVEDGALYVAMITGEGAPLANKTIPMPQRSAVEIGLQMCNAMNYLAYHTEFPNHGALEPSTIFITDGGRIKVTNLAALLGAAPPEISDISHQGMRADVFGVGATVLYALSGWAGDYRTDSPPLDSLCKEISTDLCEVLARALNPDPSLRYASCTDLRYALLRVL